MKKITLFLPSLANGGAERIMLNIANKLVSEDGLKVDLLLVSKSGPYLSQVDTRINIVDLNKRRILFSIFAVIKYLRANKPDAVLSALDTTNLVMIWAKLLSFAKSRIVVSVHCNFTQALKGAKNRRASLLPYLVGVFYSYSDCIVAVSRGVADDLCIATRVCREDVEVLVNPVITPAVEKMLQEDLVDPWVTESEVPVVLGIGRLTFQKNFQNLVLAFNEVLKFKDARLLILGDGEDKNELNELVNQLNISGKVKFAGFVENPYVYMKEANVFVLSSRYEGLPTVLIEALFAGTQVVSTDCPSGPSEILNKGRMGRLVPVEDSSLLARAIIDVLGNDVEPIDKAELEQYYLDNVCKQYLRVLLPDFSNSVKSGGENKKN